MLKICQLDEFDRWMEKMMKYSRMGVVIIVLLEVLAFFALGIICHNEWKDKVLLYILNYLLFPTIRNIIIVGLGSMGVKLYIDKKKKVAAYSGMIAISLMICNMVYTHNEIVVLMGAIGIPILLAITMGEKRFIDNISLFNGLMLLIIQIKVVEHTKMKAEVVVMTLVCSGLLILMFYIIARGLLTYYGDVLNCWSMISEVKKIDSLSGLLCKAAICNELEETIEEGRGSGMSIALISVDSLREIDEKYGGEKIGIIINELGSFIKRFANNSIKIGRYGEDEFILIFEKHGVMQVVTVCELIRDFVYTQKVAGLKQGEVTVSIGIATLSNMTKDHIELLIKGKEALKKAKESGKNKTVIS